MTHPRDLRHLIAKFVRVEHQVPGSSAVEERTEVSIVITFRLRQGHSSAYNNYIIGDDLHAMKTTDKIIDSSLPDFGTRFDPIWKASPDITPEWRVEHKRADASKRPICQKAFAASSTLYTLASLIRAVTSSTVGVG